MFGYARLHIQSSVLISATKKTPAIMAVSVSLTCCEMLSVLLGVRSLCCCLLNSLDFVVKFVLLLGSRVGVNIS